MGNIIVGIILLVVFALSISKVVHDKRRGVKCIGCPHGGAEGNKSKACHCSEPVDITFSNK